MSETVSRWEEWNSHGGPRYPHEKVVQFTFRNFSADVRRTATALDLGCGSGVHCRFLASEGFEVHGIDIAESGVSNTKALLSVSGLKADIRVGSVDRIDYADNMFDLVICMSVLECVRRDVARAAFSEVIRVLKPRGRALLMFASESDFRLRPPNMLGLAGFSDAEVQSIVPREGLAVRWIDRYITTQKNQTEEQNDFLVSMQKE